MTPACARSSRLLAQAGQFGPRGVEVALGAFGAGAQLAARFLEHLGAGFQRGAQLVALAGRVGAQLLELPRGVLPGPRGFRAGVLGAGLGGGGALVRALGGLPVLPGLLVCLVTVALGGTDEGLRVGAGLAYCFLRRASARSARASASAMSAIAASARA